MIMQARPISANLTVTFWGAARTVTGSMHLVEVGDQRILLDCGAERERQHSRVRSPGFPVPPPYVDVVVLSHAHVDHCGALPRLIREGFTGPIYCTRATAELVAVMLADSARFQEEEAQTRAILQSESANPAVNEVRQQVHQVLRQVVCVPYCVPTEILPGVFLTLVDAGHILGSAMIHLMVDGPGRETRLTFTGDIGRRGLPFLHPAAPVPPADLVVCESTYGGRYHQTVEAMTEVMARTVRRSVEQGGVVLIPAFSLGRTQLAVHYLQKWMRAGQLPRLPVFVDSPLAAEVADVYERFPEAFPTDEDTLPLPPLEEWPTVRYVRSRSESDELAERRGPCVIVASGGMCDGGRIVKHLKRHLDDPRASVVLISYQAPDTLGRQLLEQRPTVRLHGRNWNKWLDVVELNGFSGHADHADLLAYLEPLTGSATRLRLVHGEPHAAQALAEALLDRGFDDVAVPAREDTVHLA